MTDIQKSELLPCPFCGGEAEVEVAVKRNECRYYEREDPDEYRIVCTRCGACNSDRSFKDKAGQIKAWNNRELTAREAKAVKALEWFASLSDKVSIDRDDHDITTHDGMEDFIEDCVYSGIANKAKATLEELKGKE